MQLSITESEHHSLLIAHRLTKDKKQADRIKAMVSLYKGHAPHLVCDILLIDGTTLRRWYRTFKQGGVDALIVCKATSHSHKLTSDQEQQLDKELLAQIYPDNKAVIHKVKELFGVTYSPSGVTKLLHRLGFSYHCPKVIPGKADASKQTAALAEIETLQQSTSPDHFYYLDGVHPVHQTVAVRGWIKKGEVREIKTNTGRDRVNINGALNLQGDIVYREDKTLNNESTVKLLEAILAKHTHTPGGQPDTDTIYAVCDNARYYYCKEVRAWLATHQRFKLIYLPPYSPNLNRIERLWRLLRDKVLVNTYYPDFKQFKQAIIAFLDSPQIYQPEISRLLAAPCQIIGSWGF